MLNKDRRVFLSAMPIAGLAGFSMANGPTPDGITHATPAAHQSLSRHSCGLCILDFIPKIYHNPIRMGECDEFLDPYFDLAIAAASDTHGWPGAVVIPAGVYRISRPIVCPYVSLIGESRRSTIIDGSAMPSDGEIVLQWALSEPSGVMSGAMLRSLTFRGGGEQMIGVESRGITGLTITDCRFQNLNAGVQFHNRDAGMFTEACTVENCEFDISCGNAVRYRVSDGNDSFHGCGLVNCNINTLGLCINIEKDALVYNAPLSARIWVYGGSNPLIYNTGNVASFFGHLGVEVFVDDGAVAFGAQGSAVNLLGTLQAFSAPEKWQDGALVLCTRIVGDRC